MITIIDYGIGNVGSIENMLRYLGSEYVTTSKISLIASATKIILPGVGSFDAAMTRINEIENLRAVLDYKAKKDRVPILGLCLGMQLFANNSEEGSLKGLGWVPGSVKKLLAKGTIKVPHMGWNTAIVVNNSALVKNVDPSSRFYFVHSYYMQVEDKNMCLMRTSHGIDFDSAVMNGNIYGVQFHPEKSLKSGMLIFRNFIAL